MASPGVAGQWQGGRIRGGVFRARERPSALPRAYGPTLQYEQIRDKAALGQDAPAVRLTGRRLFLAGSCGVESRVGIAAG